MKITTNIFLIVCGGLALVASEAILAAFMIKTVVSFAEGIASILVWTYFTFTLKSVLLCIAIVCLGFLLLLVIIAAMVALFLGMKEFIKTRIKEIKKVAPAKKEK